MEQKLIGFGQLVVGFLVYGFAQSFFIIPVDKNTRAIGIVFNLVVVSGILMVLYSMYQKRLNQQNLWNFTSLSQKNRTKFKSKNFTIALIALLAIWGIQIIAEFLLSGTSTNQNAINKVQQNSNIFMLNLWLVFIAPAFEEIIFRGFFFNFFFSSPTTSKLKYFTGILVNGIIFGLCHEPKLDWFTLVYTICGMILAYEYTQTKDLTYPYFTHLSNNLLVMFATL
ncbi:CPBP family intramembrane metalloprotease [Lactobacillus sp. ESL0233]|uniref:CPBP family intramembrane glutamic endopeptidase n=1 Tax=Lactobacillus sp. ESL0233 TaxID=2069354 RepID=UPI000EFC1766|nr:CPBP family intramembrane glutamic endopeptidase [Lactobacillus sp. ESL0233]RMC39067.1 CPBP family intramembrane metalloprotease [Lactobacillus sp. ESL0233]